MVSKEPRRLVVGARVRFTDPSLYPHLPDATLEVAGFDQTGTRVVIRYTRPDGTGGTLKAAVGDFAPL